MNLRPEKINSHAQWTKDKIQNIERSRIGGEPLNNSREARDYYEKIAAFYLVHMTEVACAEAVLRNGGIGQNDLDSFRKIAEASVPENLRNPLKARGWFARQWAWLKTKFTWEKDEVLE